MTEYIPFQHIALNDTNPFLLVWRSTLNGTGYRLWKEQATGKLIVTELVLLQPINAYKVIENLDPGILQTILRLAAIRKIEDEHRDRHAEAAEAMLAQLEDRKADAIKLISIDSIRALSANPTIQSTSAEVEQRMKLMNKFFEEYKKKK